MTEPTTPRKIQIITLFPDMFTGVFEHSMLLKAVNRDIVDISYVPLRDFGLGPRKIVDDTPFGGGDGMLLKPEPLFAAVEHAKKNDPMAAVLLMSPRGNIFRQATAKRLAGSDNGLIIICGRYEGYDERITKLADEQISIGRFVLTGGEIPAMVVVDSVVRLIPGVLGGDTSAEKESYSTQHGEHLVEYPQYTRPRVYRGLSVPKVLLSGNHQKIESWRKQQAQRRSEQLKQDDETITA